MWCDDIGYKPLTTFWVDFSIAERFGIAAIKDTYKRVFNEWHGNYKYVTELVLILNHKIWQWYKTNEAIAEVYNDLWAETDRWACENLKGREFRYFAKVLD